MTKPTPPASSAALAKRLSDFREAIYVHDSKEEKWLDELHEIIDGVARLENSNRSDMTLGKILAEFKALLDRSPGEGAAVDKEDAVNIYLALKDLEGSDTTALKALEWAIEGRISIIKTIDERKIKGTDAAHSAIDNLEWVLQKIKLIADSSAPAEASSR
jgi:hypothetical protein